MAALRPPTASSGHAHAARREVARPAQVAHEVGEPLVGVRRLLETRVREVQLAAVVRLQHEQPDDRQVVGGEHVLGELEVAERLAHLLGVDLQHAAVQPVGRERHAGRRLGLRDLVLVVREDEVAAAAVDVEGQAELHLRHRRALDVPAGAALAPRARPVRLARLGGLPEREVERVALAVVVVDARLRLHLVDVAAGQLAVRGEAADAK